MKCGIQQIYLRQYQYQENDDQQTCQNHYRQRIGIPLLHFKESNFSGLLEAMALKCHTTILPDKFIVNCK